jgi:hypothetical protein
LKRDGGVVLFPHFLDHNFAKVSGIRYIQRNIFGTWGFKPLFIESQIFGSSKTNSKQFRIELHSNVKPSLLALYRNLAL